MEINEENLPCSNSHNFSFPTEVITTFSTRKVELSSTQVTTPTPNMFLHPNKMVHNVHNPSNLPNSFPIFILVLPSLSF